jgi:hypothetical protein
MGASGWRAAEDRGGGGRPAASGVGGRAGTTLARVGAAVRAIPDPGGQNPARLAPFQADDRDCTALIWLARQGAGRPVAHGTLDALRGAVRHRRGLVADRRGPDQQAVGRRRRPTPDYPARGAAVRAAAFAAHRLPSPGSPPPEHLYAATELAPAAWQSASLHHAGASPARACQSTATRSWASPGGCPNTRSASASETRSCAAAAWVPSMPGSPWPATPAGSALPC